MMKPPPAPELVQAYTLIKAGDKSQAGQILKAYLAQNKHDAQAWWLMAHTVGTPEHARHCLETVLKLEPDHEPARARLEKLAGQTPPDAKTPVQPPVQPPAARSTTDRDDDFPDDELILGRSAAAAPPPPPAPVPEPVPAPDPARAPEQPASFEEFLAANTHTDPFAGPPLDDPFAPDPGSAQPPPAQPRNAVGPAGLGPKFVIDIEDGSEEIGGTPDGD